MITCYTSVEFDGKEYRYLWQVKYLIIWRKIKCILKLHKKDDYKLCHWCSKVKKEKYDISQTGDGTKRGWISSECPGTERE